MPVYGGVGFCTCFRQNGVATPSCPIAPEQSASC